MTTKLLYFEDTYQLTGNGTIASKGRGEKGGYFTLPETYFYPQGGGQQSDVGYIIVGNAEIPVTFVGFSDGIVQHFVPETYFEKIGEGTNISYQINEAYRIKNAKLHTAGHLISHIIETISPAMIPIKGYHFNNGAYVEFIDEQRVGSSEMIEKINQAITDAIEEDWKITAKLSNYARVCEIRSNLAPFIPKDKPTRIVTIGNYIPLPCGGTHVKSTGEISDLTVTRIKRKKGYVKVSYQF